MQRRSFRIDRDSEGGSLDHRGKIRRPYVERVVRPRLELEQQRAQRLHEMRHHPLLVRRGDPKTAVRRTGNRISGPLQDGTPAHAGFHPTAAFDHGARLERLPAGAVVIDPNLAVHLRHRPGIGVSGQCGVLVRPARDPRHQHGDEKETPEQDHGESFDRTHISLPFASVSRQPARFRFWSIVKRKITIIDLFSLCNIRFIFIWKIDLIIT